MIAYCIRKRGDPPPDPGVRGVEGLPVRLLEDDALGLWWSPGDPGLPEIDSVREYDAVVRAALRSATPVPLRFGTPLADEEEARQLLHERRDELLESLGRVGGRVEIGLRILWETPPAPAPEPVDESGRAYLESRRAALRQERETRARATEIAERVGEHFAALDAPMVRQLLPAPGVAAALAHLVHRGSGRLYRQCLEEARAAIPGVRLKATGPWAPYSFV